MLDLILIGASLAANGLLWFFIGNCNLRNARAKTVGPAGSNFERVAVEGERALQIGRRRRGWGLAGVIVGALVALGGLLFGPVSLELPFIRPIDDKNNDKKNQALFESIIPAPSPWEITAD